MKILITGGCGFVGSNLAIYLKKRLNSSSISSLDNLMRNGSHLNKLRLLKHKIKNYKIDIEVEINTGSKNFTFYTMDLTKKYIEINADYRS